MNDEYQLIILGAGPAGLAAGLYAARNKLNTVVVEKAMPGGLVLYADQIENYPGFPDGIGGMELGELMLKQCLKFGLKVMAADVLDIDTANEIKTVKTSEGDLTARAVIIALGSERVNLEVPGEKELVGRGVSYCATCDAAFFKNQKVAVVGGGNSAISEALHLAKFASEVNIIHRRSQFRATPVFVDKARAESKIRFVLERTVDAIEGREMVEKLKLNNVATGEKSDLPVSGVFVAIGQKPNTGFLKDKIVLDSGGYVVTNEKMETDIPGILAAGDIRSNSIRQTISAAGDGATAAMYADRYITGI
ncbi:MAG: thioredoxin-disulfide reductase [Dehalococcoidales bacterium]|nr:thioredoxin-disulfide reductase [Dehalococcoidales bacterium]